ncbi:MAG: hypothetical protein RIF37_13365 [Rhodospirillaceae bacterium]
MPDIDTVLDENAIVTALAEWLRSEGFTVDQALTTKEKGVDIIASRGEETWYIEAKGGTSTRKGSPRHGEEFNPKQILNRVAQAFYTGAKMLNDHGGPKSRVFLAFPDSVGFRNTVKPIINALTALGIELLWVNGEGRVREISARKNQPSK